MKQLDRLIRKVGSDKLLHFLTAYSVTSTGTTHSLVGGGVLAAAILLLSVVKELWLDDRADWYDLLAAVAGCACSVAIAAVIVYALPLIPFF